MNSKPSIEKSLAVVTLILLLSSWTVIDSNWKSTDNKSFTLFYTDQDEDNLDEYSNLLFAGIAKAKNFFGSAYKSKFDIYIHPNRKSLDSTWQKDWNMPTFKSECWMVASGVGKRLDVISPKTWDKEACDHKSSDEWEMRGILWHELVHVFHGQFNASPDFSDVENVDWFVEGLATYASGQLDSARIAEVKKLVAENKVPAALDNFWTGKSRYGLSGSVVMYIDKKYGRKKLVELLPFNKKAAILQCLKISETELLNDWSSFIRKL